MTTGVVQLNTRLDAELKRSGDVVFSRLGLKTSDVIRAIWQYAVTNQTAPDCVLESVKPTCQTGHAHAVELARSGCGLALTCLSDEAGEVAEIKSHHVFESDSSGWDEIRDDMYDAMLEKMESRCH